MIKPKSLLLILILLIHATQMDGVEIFSRKLNSENGLPDDNVRNIAQDSRGFIWMGTPGGLYRFDNYFYTTYKYSETGNTKLLNNNHITALFSLPGDKMLIAEHGGKFSVFDVNQNKFVDVPEKQKRQMYANARKARFDRKALTPYKSIIDNGGNVINDNLGNMVVLDTTGLVWFIDKNTGETIKMRVFDRALYPLVSSKKYKVVTSRRNGLIWVSTNGCGITVYDRKARTTQHIRQGTGLVSTDFIVDMYMDKNEDVWVADEFHGVACLTACEQRTTVKLIDPMAMTLRGNQVYVMKWMPDRTLLIANTLGDVYKSDPSLRISPKPTLRNMDVHSVCFDGKGEMWIGTRQKGILTADNKWLAHNPKDPSSVSGNNIYYMLCDSKNRIWVAPEDSYLDLAIRNTDGTYKFRHFFNNAFAARVMLQDRDGTIWVGTRNGLYCFDPDKLVGSPSAYKQVMTASELHYCDVTCIFEDSKGRLWIGTMGDGAYRLDKATKTEDGYVAKTINDLISKEVHSIIEDRNGVIWMGTNKGMTCYNTLSNRITYYYDEYNLRRNFHADNSACLLPDGRLAFGTNAGIVVYSPDQKLRGDRQGQSLSITDILVNGVSVGLMEEGITLKDRSGKVSDIRLAHDQNSLTVRFSTFNFRSATSTRYRYCLDGYDNEWSELSAHSFASYKNLPPGKYTLHVKACDNGTFSNDEGQLRIIISQPWWNTWVAYLAYVALAIAIGYVTYRQLSTIYRLRQRISIEKKLTEYKLQFFTNISHEFRTPLTIICGAMQRINCQTLPAEMRQPVSNMSKSVNRMTRLINQLLEFRKMQNGKLRLALEETDVVEFIKEIYLNFKDIADNKQIAYVFISQEKQKTAYVDRSHLDKIVYNILSNAFKYTPSHGEIRVTLNFHDNRMTVKVEDNGIGIPKEKQPELFQRFMQSSFSSDSIGIGLNLTKALVDVHHGQIRHEPNKPKGSAFIVELPIGKEDYGEADFMGTSHGLAENTIATKGIDYKEVANKPLNDRKVLIVEDDSDVMDYLRGFMQRFFIVHTAMDGVEALRTLETLRPDLIVSDIMMPLMDGLEFTSRVRGIDEAKDVPIILLTALSDDGKRIRGMENGADAYITKPFDPQLLITTAAKLIEKHDMMKERYMKKTLDTKVALPEIIIDERDRRLLDSLDMWLEKHLKDPLLSVDEAAAAMGYSRTNFYKKMKSVTGQSPADYIRTQRLNKAAELLRDETTTVAEVCYEVGFSKPNYFAKVFKDQFGVSPKKYQQGT